MTAGIVRAATTDDYAAFGALVRSYVAWCRERYAAMPWVADMVFGHQALDREMEGLARSYGPPQGKVLLAVEAGVVQGGVAYRRLSSEACEMKRLFIPAAFQGRGLGRTLGEALLAEAAADGYAVMRLDALHLFTEAQRLYRGLGFAERTPYVTYPEALLPFVVFMERRLG